MNGILLLGLLGIGIGGFYGLLASGIVIGHKGSGLINLDQGALAMYPAYTFMTMRNSGDIYFPWVDFIPGPIDIPYQLSVASTGVGKLPSFIAAIMMSFLLGIAVQTLVFGPLRNKPPVSKIIGSLGALFYLTSVAAYQFGFKNKTIDGILPQGTWKNPLGLDGQLSVERIALVIIALLIGGGLTAYYRFTSTGLATRAIEDSETGATLLGHSIRRISTLNWVLSTLVTGLAGILALDLVSLSPNRYTLFVIPALGAALFGNLTSPWLATIGGVLLGVFQSATAGLTLKSWWPEWIPSEGLRHATPLLMIIIFQYTRGHKLPVRGSRFASRQPKASPGRNILWQFILITGIVIWVLAKGSSVTQGRLITSIIAAILMMSSVVIIGYLGQLSLANLTFAGVAAYLSTRLAADGVRYGFSPFVLDGPGLPSPIAMLFGVAIAVLIGLIIAAPAIRIRGLQLAVVTLAGAVATNELVLANEPLVGKGARSNLSVPPPKWFGVDITVDPSVSRDRTMLIIFCSIWLLIVVFAVVGLRRGMIGRKFLAVRANERAAAAVGVNVSGTKLLGFGIGSAIAGIAGVLTAYQHTVLQVSGWDALSGIANVTLLFLGGVAHIGGALLGAFITPGGLFSSSSSEGQILRNAAAGAIMIAVAIFRPDGLVSLMEPIKERFFRVVNHFKKIPSHSPPQSSGVNDF
ncbi:MAG: ABC transporter permease [Acidimicrobiales bacterium]|nr:ABC transporter permease [Acidimicrobiales bacterium]